jgi:hypothetical protein
MEEKLSKKEKISIAIIIALFLISILISNFLN